MSGTSCGGVTPAASFGRRAAPALIHFLLGFLALLLSATAFAEGSRTLYPASYPAAGFRGDLDLTGGAPYAGVATRKQFLYVYANAGEYILLGSSNRANGGDIFVYNPQSFGAKGAETVPVTADFTCSAATAPAGSFSGGTLGTIAARANELAGPNSADNSVTVTNGYAPCAYLAPTTGIYGVTFTAATSGGSGPTGSVGTLHVGSATVAAWEVAVRAGAASLSDINARVFTYGFIAFTGANSRPVYHTLYYATLDGQRYQQTMQGFDPNGYALWGNQFGFLDNGHPLYKDVRGGNSQVSPGTGQFIAELSAQVPEAPVFVSSIDPAGPNAASATTVLQALGIPLAPSTPQLNNAAFNGLQSGNQTYVGGGGTFTFTAQDDTSYQIVISAGTDFDPGNPANATLTGFAPDGNNTVQWNGLANNGSAFPTGTFNFQIVGRNGEIHFPIIDDEGNKFGGPTLVKLNGANAGDHTVYYDDRGYVTRNGTTIGTLNGALCPASSTDVPPTPDHSLLGQDSSAQTFSGAGCNGGVGTCFYRYWPNNGNYNLDCTNNTTNIQGFGDAKALDLWSYQQTPTISQTIIINPQPVAATVATSVSVPPTAYPGSTVNGSFAFQNVGSGAADNVTYTATIGTPGNCPTNVQFPLLPAGVTFTYDAATCAVTLNGMPTTLASGQSLNFNFSYTAPASGSVPVATVINSSNGGSANANGVTQIIAADVTTTVSVPTAAPGGSTVNGIITYGNSATATATASGVTYAATIGTPGSCPTNVTFPTLPAGATANYNSSSCQVTFSNLPASLAPGTTLTIGFQYTGPATGTVPVNSSIATTTPESNTANDTSSGTTTFNSADLALVKNGPASVNADGTITWTLVIRNNGPDPGDGATYSDAVPTGVTSVAASCGSPTGGAVCANPTVSGNNVSGTVPTLPNGGSVTVTITATAPANGGSISNTASVNPPANTSDPVLGNNSGTATTTVNPVADVSIVKSGPASVMQGGSISYTLTIANAGPSAADGATYADSVPGGISGVAASCGGVAGGAVCANPTVSGNNVSGSVPTLPSGGSVVITITGTVSFTATNLSNTADVSPPSGTTDPNTGNNSSTVNTTVAPLTADLSIVKSGPASVNAGGTITYTLTIANAGPSAANGASYSDTVPAGITGVAASCGSAAGSAVCANPTVSGNNVTGTVPVLPSGGSVVITITGTAPAGAGTLTNTATVTPPTGVSDPNPSNNTSTVNTTVTPVADVSIAKTGPASVMAGGSINYTLVIGNAGPSAADGASYSDAVPAGITGVAASCGGATGGAVCANPTVSGNNVTGTVPTLPKSGAVTITITGTAPANGGSIANTATVAPPSGTSDPNPNNNTSTANTTVNASADLAISKAGPAMVNAGGTITYTLSISNKGPSAADGASYSDAVPAAITAVMATCGSAAGGAACANPTVSGNNVTGTVPTLPSGGSVVITILGTAPTTSTTLSNTATVTPPAGVTDPVNSNNTSTVSTTVTPVADIGVTKTVNNTTPNVGDTVTFTVTTTNHGPSDATGVVATDGLPSGLTLVSATPSQGTYNSGTGAWAIGALANGNAATLSIVATVTQPGAITNTATVTASDQPDPNTANNSAGAALNANPSADVQVQKTVDNATPNVGSNVTFTITTTNAGPDPATGVAVTDVLPTGLAFVSATPATGTYNAGTGVWTIGNMANGASTTLSIVANVTQPGAITNTATKTGENEHDPVSANNQSGVTINGQQADIQVVKTVDNANPNVGSTVTFTITTTNNGPSAATGVTVTDVLPAGLTFVSATPSQGTYNSGTGVWTIGNLAASGAGATVTLQIQAKVTQSGTLTNTASKSAEDQPDPNTGNNSSSVSLNGNPQADLAVTKSGPASVIAGDNVTYTITVTNNGPSTAQAAQLADPTPAGLTFVSATAPCTGGFPCSLGTLTNGQVVSLTATYAVPSNYAGANPIVNTATVSSSTPDPNSANNTGSASTSLGAASADLSIQKSGPASIAADGTIMYTLVIGNAGPSSADGATYSDPLPAGVTLVSAACGTPTGGAACGAVTPAGNTVNGTVTTLPPGGTVTVTITATAPASAGTLTNTATVTPPTGVSDPNPNNNTSTVNTTVTVAPSADLAVVKTGPASATPSQNVSYTLAVTNNGPDVADNVQLNDATPAGLSFVSASAPCAGGFPCNLGTLANGGNVTVTVVFAVPANYSGTSIANTATVSSTTPDPNGNNNSSSVTTPVTSSPPPPPAIPAPVDARWMLILMGLLLAGVAVRERRRRNR